MPSLDFATDFTRVLRGDLDPQPDPFVDMEGILDNWWDEGFRDTYRRPRPWNRQVMLAPDDGDPAHARADQRASERGLNVQNLGNDLLSIARSQIGADYDWADANPRGAGQAGSFDCSGYTQWVLSRFGIQTDHMASSQQQQFRGVKRGELQPGDLIFYNYGRKAAGVADHVAIYIGGGQQIAASSAEDQVAQQPVDWEHFIGGGATGIAAEGVKGRSGRTPVREHEPQRTEPGAPAPYLMLDDLATGGTPAFGSVLASLMQPVTRAAPRTRGTAGGKAGSVTAQLRNGFIDAGRPDLAKMVNTQDFKAWIDAESGWNVDSVSQYFPGHGRNFGLFQFWQGHPWTENYLKGGDEWTADAYTQAKLVARYFPHLTPDDIRRYAEQIRNGQYRGWG
jgi:cell wall-associated NlpC family hydrolase